MRAHNNPAMRARRFVILLSGLLAFGCADDLVPITARWNQAEVVRLKRISELKASVAEIRAAAAGNRALALNDWRSEEAKTSIRNFETGVRDVEQLFLINELAVNEALRTGKLSIAKPVIDRAEADFDAAVVRLVPAPAQIHAALEGTRHP